MMYKWRFTLYDCRTVNRAPRSILTVLLYTRAALWGFIKIIGIPIPTLHKITFVNELHKLISVSGCGHPDCLPDGSGRERKRIALLVGRKIKI